MIEKESKFLDLFFGRDISSCEESQFTIVKQLMEATWPKMWTEYLKNIFSYKGNTGFHLPEKVNFLLNLSNLIKFLLEEEQVKVWNKEYSNHPMAMHRSKKGDYPCECKGYKQHPALTFWRE